MSIYDREYARESRSSPRGNMALFFELQPAVAWIIVLNVAVWILWLVLSQENGSGFMRENFLVSRDNVCGHYRLHTLLTYAFSHREPWHLLLNMLVVWFFGRELEELYGTRNFVWLYLLGALAAGLAHVGMSFTPWVTGAALGASGAAMALLGVYACLFPERRILLFFFIPVAAKWLVVGFAVLDLFGLFGGSTGVSTEVRGPIANAAHLGGLAAGLLYWKFDWRLFRKRSVPGPGLWQRLRRLFRRRPRLRIVERRPDEAPPGPADTPPAREAHVDARTAARVDELLAKIHREGMQALTDEERTFLRSASEKYRAPKE